MRALATCLTKAGKLISPVEARMLKESAERYRAEGFTAHESNVGAVSEAMAELKEDLKSIREQVKGEIYAAAERVKQDQIDTRRVLADTVNSLDGLLATLNKASSKSLTK